MIGIDLLGYVVALATGGTASASPEAAGVPAQGAQFEQSAVGMAAAEPRVSLVVARATDVDTRRRGTVQVVSTRPQTEKVAGPVRIARPRGSPLASAVVTSRYGRRLNPVSGAWGNHRGVDLAAKHGSPVYATAGGVVTHAGWRGSYGILVVVRHGDGVETRYAHLSAVAVSTGARVRDGAVLGYVGSTGRSTGPHLHYEIRRNGAAMDPSGSVGN